MQLDLTPKTIGLIAGAILLPLGTGVAWTWDRIEAAGYAKAEAKFWREYAAGLKAQLDEERDRR
jgi:lipopolysaccharide biosynthesis regulator YciM